MLEPSQVAMTTTAAILMPSVVAEDATAGASAATTVATRRIRLPTSYVDDPTALLYKTRWEQHVQLWQAQEAKSRTTIYGLCFHQHNQTTYLVGCTSTGHIYVWKVPMLSEDGATLLGYSGDPCLQFTVSGKRQGYGNQNKNRDSGCCLYSLQLVKLNGTSDDDDCLVVSGEGGIYLINWTKDVAPHLLDIDDDNDNDDDTAMMVKNKKKKKKRKAFDPSINVNIVRHLKPHASAAPAWNGDDNNGQMVEINDFALDHDNADPYHIYGAAGDAFGCYKWNLERGEVVATYRPQNNNNGLSRRRNGNSGYCNNNYLHTVNMTTSHPHAILLGGENGTLELWDTHADQRIEAWTMGSSTTANNDGSSSSGWVGASAMAGDWWHVGGGRGGGSNNSGESGGGFVASFHGPTRCLVTNRTTPEVIQYLQYDTAATTLYSVGSESFVSRWDDPCTLRQRQKIGCSTASGFATAVLPGSSTTSTTTTTGGLVAVAGTGSTVDLFDRSTAMPFCQFHVS
jgi:hypothetical protein